MWCSLTYSSLRFNIFVTLLMAIHVRLENWKQITIPQFQTLTKRGFRDKDLTRVQNEE